MTTDLSISDEDVDKAMDLIARTPAGYAFYCGLHKTALSLPVGDDISRGALLENFSRRKFARELMSKMAKGIDESHGRADPTNKPTSRPLVFRAREPAVVNKPRSVAERLLDEYPITGPTGLGPRAS